MKSTLDNNQTPKADENAENENITAEDQNTADGENPSDNGEFTNENTRDTEAGETSFTAEEIINDTSGTGNSPVTELEAKKKRKRKILFTVLFLLANALVVLVIALMEDRTGAKEPWANVRGYFETYWYYLVLAFGMFALIIAGDSLVFFTLMNRMNVKKSLSVSMRVSVLGRYYDRVTPWAMGGEPFQLAYLIKNKMKASDACAVTMSRHIIRFFVTAIVVIGILVSSRINTDVWVMAIAILSVLGGLIVPVFMIVCCFKPKIGQAIAKGTIGLLHKLKIVKDYDMELAKLQRGVDNFLKGIEYLSANKRVIIVIGLVALIELFANNSVPFLVMKSLGLQIDYWRTLVLCLFVNYASSFAPTPGGAGIAELSFYAIFASHVGGGLLFWAVLMWRLAVYYVPVFIGFVLQLIEGSYDIAKKWKI